MADRRMFSKEVVFSDSFVDLSPAAQALYLHLNMSADDDGFTTSIRASLFQSQASEADIAALIDTGFIYRFDDGVIVILDWLKNNFIRKDRYKPTSFQHDYSMVLEDEDKRYTIRLPSGCQEVATDKNNSSENNTEQSKEKRKEKDNQEESDDDRFFMSGSEKYDDGDLTPHDDPCDEEISEIANALNRKKKANSDNQTR